MEVFLSHQTNPHDTLLVQQVAAKLTELGINVWYDQQNLQVGHEILDEVQREVYDRPIFLIFLSPEALASRWVRDEATWAFTLRRQDVTRVIIPITTAPLPHPLGREWLFLEEFLRIEQNGQPLGNEQIVERVVALLNGTATPPSAEEDIATLLQQGNIALARHEWDAAITIFTLATKRAERQLAGWMGLGEAHLNGQEIAEALASFDRAVLIMEKSSAAQAGRGRALLAAKRPRDAHRAFDRAFQLDRHNAEAWFGLGEVAFAEANWRESVKLYDHALKENRFMTKAYIGAAAARIKWKDFAGALAMYERALALDKANSGLYLLKGELLSQNAEALAQGDRKARYYEAIDAYWAAFNVAEGTPAEPLWGIWRILRDHGTAVAVLDHLYAMTDYFPNHFPLWDAIAAYTQPGGRHLETANAEGYAVALEQLTRLKAASASAPEGQEVDN